jgi:hypothetical protein
VADSQSLSGRFTDGIRPRWYPRVPQHKVRLLYEDDAQGILDEDLLQDVGFALYQRCRSILIATEAHEGRATCPRCRGKIPHDWDRAAVITCPDCGWETTWDAYLKTYQDKHLHGGGAVLVFRAYVEEYPRAESPRARWLLVDRLIHAFHHAYVSELAPTPTRPAACNLIEGKWDEVEAFLSSLTYGPRSAPEAVQQASAFREISSRQEEHFRAIREASLRRRRGAREGD